MAGKKSLCSDYPQSTEKTKRCEAGGRQQVWCCSSPLCLGNCCHRRYFCAGVQGVMAAVWTESSAEVAAQITGVWDVLWLLDCMLLLLSLPELAVLKLEWMCLQTLHCSADTHTHMCAHTHTHTHRQSLESPTPVCSCPLRAFCFS